MEIDGLATKITAPLADLGTEASLVMAAAVTLSLAIFGVQFLLSKGKQTVRK
jgi:hypothetical protein